MDTAEYLRRYHFGSVRGSSGLGLKVEGPVSDLGGTRKGPVIPNPRLVWGRGDAFCNKAPTVLGFLHDALPLPESRAWQRQLDRTYRTLLGWFFSGWGGRAWISTIPLKPQSGHVLSRFGGSTVVTRRAVKRLGKRPKANIGFGLPDLLLNRSLFAYDLSARHPKTEFVRTMTTRTVQFGPSRQRPRGSKQVGSDYAIFLAEPGADDDLLAKRTTPMRRTFFNDHLKQYMCPHIWFCKVTDGSPPVVFQLGIGLHPGDGTVFSLKAVAHPLSVLVRQQLLDGIMLRAAGVFRE